MILDHIGDLERILAWKGIPSGNVVHLLQGGAMGRILLIEFLQIPVIVQNLVIANDRTGTVRLRRSVRSAGGRVGEGVEDRGADSQGVDHSG